MDRGAAGHGHFYLLAQDIFDDSLEIELVVGVDVDRVLQAVLLVVHIYSTDRAVSFSTGLELTPILPGHLLAPSPWLVLERDTSGRNLVL